MKSQPQQTIRILVLEDTDELREFLAEGLRDRGFEVVEATHADEAIARARERAFDLVVTDVRLEGKDGLEALADIKSGSPLVQSLVITGYASEADSIRAVQLGVGDYIKKPFGLEDFLQTISRLVSRIWEQRRLEQKDRAMLETALWALRAVATAHIEDPGELIDLASRAARNLRLAPKAVLLVQVMTVLELLSDEAAVGLEDLSPILGDLLAEAPDSAREIVDGALKVCGYREGVPVPAVADALRQPNLPESPGGETDVKALLGLSEAIEQRGDLATAARLYEELAAGLPSGPDRVTLSSRLLRVHSQLGHRDQSRKWSEEILLHARDLGPVSAARFLVESGLQLMSLDPERASEFLIQGGKQAKSLMLECELAVARLALIALNRGDAKALPASLKVLRQPRFVRTLGQAGAWLLPLLAGMPPAEESRKTLDQLIGLRSDLVSDFIRDTARDEQQRLGVVRQIESSQHRYLYTSVLESLAGNDGPSSLREAAQELLDKPATPGGPAVLTVQSLGPFTVTRNGHTIADADWGSQKIKFLLAMLMARPGRLFAEDLVLEIFWSNRTPDKGKVSLNQACTRIRRNLKSDSQHDGKYILRTAGGLRFDPQVPLAHDYSEFCEALKQGEDCHRRAEIDKAVASWRELLRFPDQEYLEGCYYDFANETRDELTMRTADALRKLAALCNDQGLYEESLESSRRVLNREKCCQESHAAIMWSYLKLGRPELAIRQFNIAESVLRQELDLEPVTALLELRERARMMM